TTLNNYKRLAVLEQAYMVSIPAIINDSMKDQTQRLKEMTFTALYPDIRDLRGKPNICVENCSRQTEALDQDLDPI
ncbi:hypothetical protein BGZ65_000619, partial [Modicella reniformis]